METLKIALLDLNARFGGGCVALANLAQALSGKGHEVHLILGMKNIPSRLAKIHLQDCHLHYTLGYRNIFDMPRLVSETKDNLLELHRVHKFDVVNVQGINGLFVPSELHNRLFVTLHGNNLARGIALLRGVCLSPDMFQATRYAFTNFMKNILGHFAYGNLEKIACKTAKLVITLTSTEANYAKQYYHLSEEKVRVVPNVVMLPKDSLGDEFVIPEDKRLILSVGALEIVKGIPILVKVAKEILSRKSDVTYVFVGDGPLIGLIRRLACRFPRRLIMFPRVSEGLTTLYKRATTLVHGSVYEALSLAIAEVMLAGKPVVAFNTSSIPELVINDVTGYLVKCCSSKEMAQRALSLLEDDRKARRLGSSARKRVEKLCNPRRVASMTEHVYKEA